MLFCNLGALQDSAGAGTYLKRDTETTHQKHRIMSENPHNGKNARSIQKALFSLKVFFLQSY